MAEELDYVPMPAKVVTLIEKMWAADIKDGSGKPLLFDDQLISRRRGACSPPSPLRRSLTRHQSKNSRIRMSAPGGEAMVDATWQETDLVAQDVTERARVLNKLRLVISSFTSLPRSAAIFVLVVLGGVIVSLFIGAMPALNEFGFGFLMDTKLESRYGKVWRARSDLRHDHHVPDRHADSGAVRAYDRDVSDRALPVVAASPDRHRHRIAGGHPQHHLRNLGAFRVRALPAATCATAR